jgi:hypothetical protein
MKYIFFALMLFSCNGLLAQKKSEKELFKLFATVCNSYKQQLPVQLTLDYKRESNIIVHADDSSVSMNGYFFISKDLSYIRFGDIEQVITDSFALVVMNNIHQMALSAKTVDPAENVSNMMNEQFSEKSIEKMKDFFTVSQSFLAKQDARLSMWSKNKIYNTDLSLQEVNLSYNKLTNDPQKVEMIKRTLIKKSDDHAFSTAQMISIPEKGDFYIKEEKTDFIFSSIGHDADKKSPVMLSDRIVKDASNSYIPAKAYETYNITFN